jgi:hypothetical protein
MEVLKFVAVKYRTVVHYQKMILDEINKARTSKHIE